MDLQAMDRCHRIGRILKRDFSKLKLEHHVVIEKGQLHQERTKPNAADIDQRAKECIELVHLAMGSPDFKELRITIGETLSLELSKSVVVLGGG
ncbi:ATP-dependent DNA helicase DDM1 [Cucumis melo var. makuwa]|uniref:ATP-dependent DNA helicase DDM1 n=1 Tax=Cucumis melo var. makuwa TaxID=1194695 RepID=A0A5D3DJ50_CUCMM|nr:ATP-dependent DNA helicase DDM1 [Cucumis melo var. makuwa]TYK23615.1 ATP-dependent DNA helicase DDM1 [Cucumis melo var. makuwa]